VNLYLSFLLCKEVWSCAAVGSEDSGDEVRFGRKMNENICDSSRVQKIKMYVRFQLFAFKPNMYRHIALPRPLIFPIRNPSKRVVQVYFFVT